MTTYRVTYQDTALSFQAIVEAENENSAMEEAEILLSAITVKDILQDMNVQVEEIEYDGIYDPHDGSFEG